MRTTSDARSKTYRTTEESLRWRTAFFEAQIESSLDGILIVDSRGRKIQQNRQFVEMWKIPRDLAESKDDAPMLKFVIDQTKDPAAFGAKVRHLYANPAEVSRDEIEVLDGRIFDRDSSPVFDKTGKYYGRIWRFRDITDRKAMEQELRNAARMDKLTGLPNRALLLDRLQHAIALRKRKKEFQYAVLFLDFDRFKIVNDSLGHETGDQLLREIARRLETAVRAIDSVSREPNSNTASRLGGDEFVVLLTDLRSHDDAAGVAERILTAMSVPHKLGDLEIVSTASIGIVTGEFGHERAEDILRDADTAMYEAKLAGKGRVAKFDESMRTRVQRKVDLESGIRRALDERQFLVHYQPIVSLQTGRIEAFEALVRWEHPVHGTIVPGEFIPVAEETGLIIPVGEWVFREVCRQIASWSSSLGKGILPPITINLSRSQLSLHNLAEKFRDITLEAGVDPSAIHLEVTESSIMADPQQAVKVLNRINDLGFRVYMDDFGTGYSSLSNLHQFPIDVLKIDRSFAANLSRGSQFVAMFAAIVMLARNLHINVIAEGIETLEQVQLLRSLNCQSAQGYFFAHAMAAAEVPDFLLQGPQFLGADPKVNPIAIVPLRISA